MFIIENGKITSDKTLDIGKIRVINLVFKSDLDFADDDKFKLILGDIQSENFAFVNDGCFRFSYVDVAEIIKKENTDLSVKVTCNDEQILSDSITITAYVQGGGSGEEIQGIVFNGSPSNATEAKIVPSDFTKNITVFNSFFLNCKGLISISQIDTSNGKDFYGMFNNCLKLTTIPQLDVSKGTTFSSIFYKCSDLTDFGGLLNVKYSYSLSYSPNLTHQSLLNALNGLYDLTESASQTLTLGSTNLAKLTDAEKAIATNKNWVLA